MDLSKEEQRAYDEMVDAGYNSWVAEGLAQRGKTRNEADLMSCREALEEVLCWNGIIGYADSIVDAVDNLRNMGKD